MELSTLSLKNSQDFFGRVFSGDIFRLCDYQKIDTHGKRHTVFFKTNADNDALDIADGTAEAKCLVKAKI